MVVGGAEAGVAGRLTGGVAEEDIALAGAAAASELDTVVTG